MSEQPRFADEHQYEWSPIVSRKRLVWPKGAGLAFVALLNLEYFETDPPPGSYRAAGMPSLSGGMPNPDIPTMSHREYGHRVGIFRVLAALAERGIRATVAIDAMSAENYPFLVDYCSQRNCEFVARGLAASRIISSAMSETEESAYIEDALARITSAIGYQPKGWFGPEHSESERTPNLLAGAGLRYVCDWSNDDQPYRMKTDTGKLFALPTALELEDSFALLRRGVQLERYSTMLHDAADQLLTEGR